MTVSAAVDTDVRALHADFDRCRGVMDRVNRSIQRYKEAIGRLKRSLDGIPKEKRDRAARESAFLESRYDNFQSRFDRAKEQADKIREDLKHIKGPRCVCSPSISSGINLYCRNAETMQNDIEEYLRKVSELSSRIGQSSLVSPANAPAAGSDGSLAYRRSTIDSLVSQQKTSLDSCAAPSGRKLWSQCRVNLHKADSLHAAGLAAEERQAIDVAELLLTKAMRVCGRE